MSCRQEISYAQTVNSIFKACKILPFPCRTLKLQDRYNATGTYTYDAVFDQDATAEEVYEKSAKERVLSAMQVGLLATAVFLACLFVLVYNLLEDLAMPENLSPSITREEAVQGVIGLVLSRHSTADNSQNPAGRQCNTLCVRSNGLREDVHHESHSAHGGHKYL